MLTKATVVVFIFAARGHTISNHSEDFRKIIIVDVWFGTLMSVVAEAVVHDEVLAETVASLLLRASLASLTHHCNTKHRTYIATV